MAKAFQQLKILKLAPTSRLTFGKYNTCRVCDVWDDYEYFLWLHKAKPALFNKACVDSFLAAKDMYEAKRHYIEEVVPYLDDGFDDVPF
jgi:uncharacterized protein (DUF3820 family)